MLVPANRNPPAERTPQLHVLQAGFSHQSREGGVSLNGDFAGRAELDIQSV
jgi:hypothetical protein